jgi:hypothetical protein
MSAKVGSSKRQEVRKRTSRESVASSRSQETWAASRDREKREEKKIMASHFANHDFLMADGANPARNRRETAAVFLVNPGTTGNAIVGESLGWIADHAEDGPFHITWYSPGALVPASLHDFRQSNTHLSAATHVHLFPGTVDLQMQAVVGEEAQDYARGIRRRFSCMLLSGHSFDLDAGCVRFHFEREIPIQKVCALLPAKRKFLFFDSNKIDGRGEGEEGYSLRELLSTSDSVCIYTVSSDSNQKLKGAFERLATSLLSDEARDSARDQVKTLRLTIVGRERSPSEVCSRHGYLIPI